MTGALDEAWRALEDGRPDEALARLDAAGDRGGPALCLATLALLDLGEVERARAALAGAEADTPADDPDLLLAQGELALAEWRLDAARAAFDALDERDPGVLARRALLADHAGDIGAGHRLLARARELDGGPPPPRLSADAFEAAVAAAAEDLPPAFREALDDVAVIVDPVPHSDLAARDPLGTPPDLLGLFVGRSLLERELEAGPEAPPTVYLFQRNLERACASERELREEIRVTLYHELGHALGFDEDEVHGMGLG